MSGRIRRGVFHSVEPRTHRGRRDPVVGLAGRHPFVTVCRETTDTRADCDHRL